MFGNFLRSLQTDKSNKMLTTAFQKYEVLICSLGYDPADIKIKVSMACWQLKLPNLVFISSDPNSSLEEQLECAEKNDINLIITIKEKIYTSKKKMSLKWRKEKNKIEKEYTLEELIDYLKTFKSGFINPSTA